MLGKGLLTGLWTTLSHLWRPAVTVQYPVQRREPAMRFRARHGLRTDEAGEMLCIGCKQCERICPDKLITVTTEKAPEGAKRKTLVKDFTLSMDACMFCGLCEEVCPTSALVMTRFYEMATQDREEILLTMEKLLESGKNYEPHE